MGVLVNHATSVPLALNISTRSITPQFHIIFDDWIVTVSSSSTDTPDFSSDDWHKMFGESRYEYIIDEEDELNSSDHHDTLLSNQHSEAATFSQERNIPASPLPVSMPPCHPIKETSNRREYNA